MKVKCLVTCQTDRKWIHFEGKTYDVPEEIVKRNPTFFEPVKEKSNKK